MHAYQEKESNSRHHPPPQPRPLLYPEAQGSPSRDPALIQGRIHLPKTHSPTPSPPPPRAPRGQNLDKTVFPLPRPLPTSLRSQLALYPHSTSSTPAPILSPQTTFCLSSHSQFPYVPNTCSILLPQRRPPLTTPSSIPPRFLWPSCSPDSPTIPFRRGGPAGCYPEEDSRGPCPFSHSFIHSTVQHSFWNSLPNATLCWGKAMTPSHPYPWDPPEALSTLLGMESRLGPGSSDQVVWLTGYTDWAGRPVMPFIWIKQLVDGERTADMGTEIKS